ncbi:MAG TPA: response regulator transcription factor [Candidatus Cybelea sp.]|nr:response regulator transcription factor [Candidatus Cybelea sp.]
MTISIPTVESGFVESPLQAASSIRVFVVQQQGLMAKALCNMLQQDAGVHIVGDASTVRSAQLSKARPDLILLDSDASFEGLCNTIGTCRMACPSARIGVLSEHLSSEVMQRAFSAGADGYVVTDITPGELVAAVKAMGSGSLYVDPRLVGVILRKQVGIARRDRNELSPRETDIVRLVATGLTNREISERLGLSDKTVKNHISHIFAKLNVTTRTQVVIHAIRSGLA